MSEETIEGLLKPQLFEVALGGEYNITPHDQQSPLHPAPKMFRIPSLKYFIGLPIGFVLLVIGVLEAAGRRGLKVWWRENSDREKRYLSALIGLTVILALIPPSFALLDRGDGEAFEFARGISIWPTEVLRLGVAVLSLFWIAVALRRNRLSRNRLEQMYLQPRAGSKPAEPASRAQRVWRRYTDRQEWQPSIRRMVFPVVLVALFFLCVQWISDESLTPARGSRYALLDRCIWYFAVTTLACLTLWILEAIRQCVWFIDKLASKPTTWPASERSGELAAARGMKEVDLADYLDVEVVAQRTQAIWPLLVYPFAGISLLLLARTSFFDNWPWPAELLTIFGILFAASILSAVLLRIKAEHVRTEAIARLRNLLSQKRGRKNEQGAAQIELLIEDVESIRDGAFSSWSHSPVVKAVAVPFGGVGALAVLDMFAQLGI